MSVKHMLIWCKFGAEYQRVKNLHFTFRLLIVGKVATQTHSSAAILSERQAGSNQEVAHLQFQSGTGRGVQLHSTDRSTHTRRFYTGFHPPVFKATSEKSSHF
jgi:hypothetical protein